MIKRVLITGGAGFLGSHLCDRLIAEGNEVICLDDFSSGSEDNIEQLLAHKGFRLVKADITEGFNAFEVDAIYNLACPASPADYQSDPVKTTRTNVVGTLNLLELAKNRQIPILQASTSEVYGDPEVHPQTETYFGNVNPIGIRACYDEGKRCAESLFFDYHRLFGTRIKIARIFNTYGPKMRPNDGRVVSSFISQALTDEDITLFGDGSQTRSFCYVDDLVDGLIKLMSTKDDFCGPVNIGNPEEYTIKKLAELIIEMTGSKSLLSFKPLPQDDPKKRKPDISLAKRELGWEAKIGLDEGLRETIAYFKGIIA